MRRAADAIDIGEGAGNRLPLSFRKSTRSNAEEFPANAEGSLVRRCTGQRGQRDEGEIHKCRLVWLRELRYAARSGARDQSLGGTKPERISNIQANLGGRRGQASPNTAIPFSAFS